jgi:hypothetical protein
MTPFQTTCLIIFAILSYLIISDKNVADYITLIFKMTRLNFERAYWIIKFHPKNPITNLIKRWECDRIAKELQKEFNDPYLKEIKQNYE